MTTPPVASIKPSGTSEKNLSKEALQSRVFLRMPHKKKKKKIRRNEITETQYSPIRKPVRYIFSTKATLFTP